MKYLPLIAVVVAVAFFWPHAADPMPGFPRVFLWAWEQPEDLRFLQPSSAGIAFLARTVNLHDGSLSVRPRFQPLRYRPGTTLMATVRVEAPSGTSLPPADTVAQSIAPAAEIPGVRALQVDFDATLSQRAFYRQLLTVLRHRVSASIPISMTALTSWCQSDGWIEGLPVVEAVPMLFRMGAGERTARSFRPALCQSSAGVSLDEPLREPPSAARLYIFNPRPWTEATFRAALRDTRKWH